MTCRVLVVILLTACGGNPASTSPQDITMSPPVTNIAVAPPPPCIRAPEGEAVVTRASGDAARVEFCVGPEAEQCFGFDLTLATLERLTTPPPERVLAGARVETTNPELKVCTGEGCKSLAPKVLAGIAPIHAATNADGTIAVILLGDASAGKGYAEVWDVTRTKKTATFRYARGPFKCGEVAMTGNTIYVSANTCGAPAARASLYTLKGKRIAFVGGKEFGTYGNAFARVEGTTWAFLEENGSRLVVQDVAKGKVIKRIDVSPLWTPDGQANKDAIGNPGESALVHLGNGKVAVIAGAPATGKVATVDLTTGEVAIARAPMCN